MSAHTTRLRTSARKKRPTDSLNPILFEYATPGEIKEVITFTKNDRTQLQSPNYLNDTIISFFMQYHIDKLVDDDLKSRVHVFSSFFIAKIKSIYATNNNSKSAVGNNNRQDTNSGSSRSSVNNSTTTKCNSINLRSTKCASRWLKGVNIFEKDFLFMPVCEKNHWLLVVVCYPGNSVVGISEAKPDEDLWAPAVFILNSMKSPAPGVKKVIQRFLTNQWAIENKPPRSFSINSAKSSSIRLMFPELPLQKNNYNCGVYLLNYFKCFMKSPRESYIKMFRGRSLSNWFEEHNIQIKCERLRMMEVVKNQTKEWATPENKAKLAAIEKETKEFQESLANQGGSHDSIIEID